MTLTDLMALWTEEVEPCMRKTMTEVEFAEIRYQLGVKRPMEEVIDPMLIKLHRQV